jgi:preprotein translocase subunit Sec63
MTDLKDWANRHSEYLKIGVHETVLCRFIKAVEFTDHENEDREKIRYYLEVDGVEKKLESQSVSLAEQMAKINPSEWCTVTRKGEGRQTTYTVIPVTKEGVPTPPKETDDESLDDIFNEEEEKTAKKRK